jgi:hypothetical protein
MLCCMSQLSVEAQVVASLASADSSLFLAFTLEWPVLAVLLSSDRSVIHAGISVLYSEGSRVIATPTPFLPSFMASPVSERFGD